ncbi:hypothetical protein [Streptomyces sp. NPDC015131]
MSWTWKKPPDSEPWAQSDYYGQRARLCAVISIALALVTIILKVTS